MKIMAIEIILKVKSNMAILFISMWLGLTLPIVLSIVFTILQSLIIKDPSGISMIVIGLLVALLDGMIGIKLFEKKIQPFFEKRRKKRRFP